MIKGYFSLMLHAHLPYVRHPEFEYFLEEDWLYEAITETYIPLLLAYENMVRDGVDFRITMSLTPPLISMLKDPLLQGRYLRHIGKLQDLANKEIIRTRNAPEFRALAEMYKRKFDEARVYFEHTCNRDLISAFKKFQDLGKLEIITCCATHGYLPLMEINRQAVRAQIKVAVNHYAETFDRRPRGIWLAECAYNPGDDELLAEEGIRFFYVDTHGILHGSHRPKFGVFAPIYCPSGVAAFARDTESSKSVWSAEEGYPGDYNYRDFYRDVGYDLEFDYIKDYIHPDGIRINTGVKYFKITGTTNHKEPYNEHIARETAASHASNFLFNREKQVEYIHDLFEGERKPIIVSPYDAELYGHWWYEGPLWIEFLCRKMHFDQDTIKMITPMEYLQEYPRNQRLTPSMSSWGNKGYNEVWLEGSNDWIYRHLHKCAERMIELADQYKKANSLQTRALNQCARELLLAQSSDWAFIMKTGTMVEYAVKRSKEHINRFAELYFMIKENRIDHHYLADLEYKDNIFPNLEYKVYRTK